MAGSVSGSATISARPASSGRGDPSCRGLRAMPVRRAAECDDAVEEYGVGHPGALRRRGELLAGADVRIGIRVEEPQDAMVIESIVDACVSRHLEDAID